MRLLADLRDGDDTAFDQLFSILYDELKDLAQRQRRRWRGDSTLGTTALLHETYVKLTGQTGLDVESRTHFLAFAARAMRHVLCNHARDRRALKRGGAIQSLQLREATASLATASADEDLADVLIALDEALTRLERLDPRQSKVVDCRFFGGLTVQETATALGVSPRTVKRDWAMAQAWLHREMTSGRT